MAEAISRYRILQVIDRLDTGGAERVMLDLSNLLSENGHIVTAMAILNLGPLCDYLHPAIKQINLNRKNRLAMAQFRQLSKIAAANDIVHVHMRHNLKYVKLAKFLFPFRTPIVFHDHYGKIVTDQTLPTSLKWALGKVIYIGVSKDLTSWAINKVKLSSDRVFELTNIIRKQNIKNAKESLNGRLRLVLVSNIRRQKNIEHAIEIVNKLKESNPVHLSIYGMAIEEDYQEELIKLIDQSDLKNEITFIEDCDNIQAELYKFDMAIHTAKSETGPLVLMEYLSQNLPFLSYETGEVVAQIKDDLPLLIIDNFDVNDWVARIGQILKQKENLSLEVVFDKHYKEENYYKECIKIYQKSLTY